MFTFFIIILAYQFNYIYFVGGTESDKDTSNSHVTDRITI